MVGQSRIEMSPRTVNAGVGTSARKPMQNDSDGRAQFQGNPTEAWAVESEPTQPRTTTSVAGTRGGAAEFFGDRLRTSMTRAKWRIAGQLWSKPSVSGLCTNSLAHRLPKKFSSGQKKAVDAGLGLLLWGSDRCL